MKPPFDTQDVNRMKEKINRKKKREDSQNQFSDFAFSTDEGLNESKEKGEPKTKDVITKSYLLIPLITTI